MTVNRKTVQLSLISIGLFLILATYFLYPKIIEKKFLKGEAIIEEMLEGKLKTNVKNEFSNVTYNGINRGNSFTINAVTAEIREDEDIVYMQKMLVTISLSDREWIIECKVGRYNKKNYNIFCSEDVKANDGKTIIYSKNLDLLTDKSATIYNDVVLLNEEESNLYADVVYYDFEKQVYTVNMYSDNESVKVKLVK